MFDQYVIDVKESFMSTQKDIDETLAKPFDERKVVAGHICFGLKAFQSLGGGCTPMIKDNGFIAGCDDTNPVRINFCPMCGVKLFD